MSKRSNTNEFIIKSNNRHENKYDYSHVDYIDNKTKVKIGCFIHGIFEQTPHSHLSGKGCPVCGGKLKSNTNEFIEKAKKIHGEKYDYTNTNYDNGHKKIKIKCLIHGEFEQTPCNHLSGYGCMKCSGKAIPNNDEFIEKAKKIHNEKYDYNEIKYINSIKKIKIRCHIHGIFEQMPNSHLNGTGCPKCIGRNKTTEEFINKSTLIHGSKYDYSLVDYKKGRTKIKIICSDHGVFEQIPHDHLIGCGCPKCNLSKGELLIENYLKENNISYITQKKFDDCIGKKKKLPFDFYLPDYNTLIEYDGRQHVEVVRFNGCSEELAKIGFESTQRNDLIKTNYCKANNIKLIRISYNEKSIIDKIKLHLNLIIK